MAAAVARHLHPMPGSFAPEDYVDLRETTFDVIRDFCKDENDHQQIIKPEIAENTALPDLPQREAPTRQEPDGVDWHKYKPPAILRKAPTVTSQVLLDIIESSIVNLASRVAEEDRLKSQEEERQRREETAARQAEIAKRLYLPIIIPGEGSTTEPAASVEDEQRGMDHGARADDARQQALLAIESPAKTVKLKKSSPFRRLFSRSPEKGESSAAGASRETLRSRLRSRLGNLDAEAAELLTRDAISRIARASFETAVEASSESISECVSCLDEFPARGMIRVPCHQYCSDCFIRLVSAAVQNEQQWPPKCCLNPIPFRTVLRVVPSGLKKTFQERSQEWNLPVSERVYCNRSDCGLWIQPDKISHAMRQGRCDRGHLTCTLCRGESHGQNECPQDRDIDLTNQLADEEGWRRCYSCHALVEHSEACQHMTCRCGSQFCYVCGERWRTCSCTMQQLYDLKEAANARRQQRIFRQQEEAEELTRILAQIEEFERAEALAAELRQQEEERLEAERRQREIEERGLAESIRLRDIGQKFRQLRESLDQLHEVQQVLIEAHHETAARDLEEEAKNTKQQLMKKQETERRDAAVLIANRLTQREQEQNHDFAVRVGAEQEVEEEYHRQLTAYWEGKENAQEEIQAAMLPLRQRMDQGCQEWRRWRDAELAAYRQKLVDRQAIQEELMYSLRLRLDDQFEEKRADLARQRVAETRWLGEVMLERERLLGEREVDELEGDADSLFAPAESDGATETGGVEVTSS
ncbi:hypothetical protein S40285_00820 [Stachybotrys chlorohalonatus IBT 40285]|uniref:RBR-type E3 ubiquitin transferase n=1 Tax=Stachybotrys chlorohalonatus (strain IBT 40285) TaxID=1283841 RepID=A0A084QJS5_STAC4|nr:hypothetical protein S40285_00820 [Stachybotrys chlorohalonata IBT 40285]